MLESWEHKAAGHHASIAKKLRRMDVCVHFLLWISSRIPGQAIVLLTEGKSLTSANLLQIILHRNTEARDKESRAQRVDTRLTVQRSQNLFAFPR